MPENNPIVARKRGRKVDTEKRGQVLAEGPYAVVSQDPRVLEAYVGVEA